MLLHVPPTPCISRCIENVLWPKAELPYICLIEIRNRLHFRPTTILCIYKSGTSFLKSPQYVIGDCQRYMCFCNISLNTYTMSPVLNVTFSKHLLNQTMSRGHFYSSVHFILILTWDIWYFHSSKMFLQLSTCFQLFDSSNVKFSESTRITKYSMVMTICTSFR